MKKIMFNDRYGLNQAVLDGRKTMTRRLASKFIPDAMQIGFERLEIFGGRELRLYNGGKDFIKYNLPYKVGEIVAIGQSYKDLFKEDCQRMARGETMIQVTIKNVTQTPGWSNKMFVRADQMHHQIRITNVRVEKLQDIGDVDCLAEGIEFSHKAQSFYVKSNPTTGAQTWLGDTPRKAYAALIDRISGKGTWERNPFVFVYEFELVK